MIHQTLDTSNQTEIAKLFTSVFTASDGEEEGKSVGKLSSELASNIDNKEIICFGSYENECLIGAIFFTPLRFNQAIQVFMLAPVAVSTGYQGKGIGQSLINFGFKELEKRSVTIAITYGDPAFYSKVGFQPLSENVIKAPLKLSIPEGWLGCSLTDEAIPVIDERPSCVKAFDDPIYW